MDLDHAIDMQPAPAAVVGGRWTLYTGELPVGAWCGVCAVTSKAPEPGARFVDIGFTVYDDTPNGDICLHEEYVREIGAAVGMVPPAEHEAALRELEELRTEVAFLRQTAEEPRVETDGERVLAALDRIETELTRRRGGRPKKETT